MGHVEQGVHGPYGTERVQQVTQVLEGLRVQTPRQVLLPLVRRVFFWTDAVGFAHLPELQIREKKVAIGYTKKVAISYTKKKYKL